MALDPESVARLAAGLNGLDAAQIKAARSAIGLAQAESRAAVAASAAAAAATKAAAAEASSRAKAEDAATKAAAAGAAAQAKAVAAQNKVQIDALKAAQAYRLADEKQIQSAAESRAKIALSQAKASSSAAQAELRQIALAQKKEKAAKDAEKAGGANDKLISKKAAVYDVLGGSLGNAANAAKAAGGPLGAIAERVEGFAAIFGRVPPQVAAVIIAVTALAAVASAGATALHKMAEAAIELTAARSALLATFSALATGSFSGAKTLAIVDKLSVSLPFASQKIAEWATELQKANLQGKSLENAIKAVGAAAALMPETGAAAAQKMITTLAMGGAAAVTLISQLKAGLPEAREQLAQMGLRVADLAAALGMTEAQFKVAKLSAKQMAEAIEKALSKKAAGSLQGMLMTFPVMFQKMKEGALSLFDKLGPAVKPFMSAVKSLFENFYKGGAVINALKPIVTSVMTTLFSWGTKAVGVIQSILKWFLASGKAGGVFSGAIAVLKAGWAALGTIWTAVKAILTPILGVFKAIMSNALVMNGIRTIFTLIAAAVVVAVVAFAAFAGVVATVVGIVSTVAGALVALPVAAFGAASAFIEGLVTGISSGAGGVLGAVLNLGASIKSGLLGALGIASPSKFAKGAASNVTETFADTVEDGAPEAGAAMKKMAQPPPKGKAGAKGRSVGDAVKQFIFNNCIFNGTNEEEFCEQLAKALVMAKLEGPSSEPQT